MFVHIDQTFIFPITMTVTAAETNSNDIQGTEIAIIPVDESDNKNKLCRPVDKEVCSYI